MFHASIRVRARVRGDAGVCAGIFTYYDDNNESDIEILTRDPTNHIRYTNQPGLDEDGNEIPGASVDAVMAGGAVWNEWNDHRLDWTEDLSVWYLNGELVHNKTYGVPSEPSLAILNMVRSHVSGIGFILLIFGSGVMVAFGRARWMSGLLRTLTLSGLRSSTTRFDLPLALRWGLMIYSAYSHGVDSLEASFKSPYTPI
jgi:hypothetical protein